MSTLAEKKFIEKVRRKKSAKRTGPVSAKNRAMLLESQKIAVKVLMRLDELKWSQKYLAEIMGVSPQQISKIVRGTENMTIETQLKLQTILKIPVLASFYENASRDRGEQQRHKKK